MCEDDGETTAEYLESEDAVFFAIQARLCMGFHFVRRICCDKDAMNYTHINDDQAVLAAHDSTMEKGH